MYNTIDELKNALPEKDIIRLTDDERLDQINVTRATDCGEAADAEVDSYCGVKYAVPFATAPAEVKRLSLELWVRNLYRRRGYNKDVEERAEKAISQLKDIARGIKSLGIDPAPSASSQGSPEVNKETDDRVFTRETMEGF